MPLRNIDSPRSSPRLFQAALLLSNLLLLGLLGLAGGPACLGSPGTEVEICDLETPCDDGSYCKHLLKGIHHCDAGSWRPLLEDKPVHLRGCTSSEVERYAPAIVEGQDLLQLSASLTLDCPAYTALSHRLARRFAYNNQSCGLVTFLEPDLVHLYCDEENNPEFDLTGTLWHELGHVYVSRLRSPLEFEVPSFNDVIGCTRVESEVGVIYRFTHENPVSLYGRTNCAEAYAEAVALFVEDPCEVAEEAPLQYAWLLTAEDSPFRGRQGCQIDLSTQLAY
ncbi:MAG: hypothetical protein A2284_11110 [Deltaproteobacteria bacterium RIFOXYA12_FULL_61_11]|nr:MAG: hypothetical protein A2284_11110 [Deltaproteobacteria bacterium RIFOXYA12_FULL_61_11]